MSVTGAADKPADGVVVCGSFPTVAAAAKAGASFLATIGLLEASRTRKQEGGMWGVHSRLFTSQLRPSIVLSPLVVLEEGLRRCLKAVVLGPVLACDGGTSF